MINQSINQSINQLINQSTNRSVKNLALSFKGSYELQGLNLYGVLGCGELRVKLLLQLDGSTIIIIIECYIILLES